MFSPFPYQEDCLIKIAEARAKGAVKGLGVMASGLGKTVTAAFDVKRWFTERGTGRLLYLCHQNDILTQASDTFRSILGPEHTFGFFNGRERKIHQIDCIFASFQTLLKRAKTTFRPDEFDYIVVDESHHTPAPTYLNVVRYFTPRFLLGLTATPDRRDGLNIRSVYGDELFHLPLEDALVQNLLTPVDYRLVTDEISVEGANADSERLTMDDLNDKVFIPKRDEEVASVISRHMKEISEPRTIVFANSITRADQIVKILPGSVTIHSKVSTKERIVRLELFRLGLVQTVVTVDCFNEGVDIPQANLIIFLRSTASSTIFLQQLGRGLRRCEGKDNVRVLDFVGNCQRVAMLKELSDVVKRRQKSQQSGVKTEDSFDFSGDQFPELKKKEFNVLGITFDEKALKVLDVIKRVRPSRISDNELLFSEYSSRNALAASHLPAKTWQELWWTCTVCSHEYKLSAAMRLSGKGCPKCLDRVTEENNLYVLHPHLAKEYSSKNPLPSWKVKANTAELYWWRCLMCSFEWRGRVRSRIYRGDGCPACAAKMPQYVDNLGFMLPRIAEEYSDVNILAPDRIGYSSTHRRWWICNGCGHNWQATAIARSRGQCPCPRCSQQVATPASNIVITHPHLAEEFASRNRTAVETVFAKTADPIWWLCYDCGRYWKASVQQRLNGASCPNCKPVVVATVK